MQTLNVPQTPMFQQDDESLLVVKILINNRGEASVLDSYEVERQEEEPFFEGM